MATLPDGGFPESAKSLLHRRTPVRLARWPDGRRRVDKLTVGRALTSKGPASSRSFEQRAIGVQHRARRFRA